MARNKHKRVYDFYHPESVVGTEFRRLLHNITRPIDGVNPSSFLITSAMLSEGKSTISSFLGLTAASHKKRKTIVIDADLRRPTLHKVFDVPLEGGLTDLIDGSVEAEDAFRSTNSANLWLLTAGTMKNNPAELFESHAVKEAIEKVKFYFDLVFIDSAPILPVSDSLVLAPEVDGVVVVVKAGETQREVISRAVDILRNVDAHISGVVLNNARNVLPYHYNYQYYGYSYASKKK